jgi:predicted nucleic acid-binding Zn ribbon protein
MAERGPQSLKGVLSELITLRGWARSKGNAQLQQVWRETAGPQFAPATRATAIKNGILHVGVGNAPLLSELAGYHKHELLQSLQTKHPELRIRDLRFKLDSDLTPK